MCEINVFTSQCSSVHFISVHFRRFKLAFTDGQTDRRTDVAA